MKFPIPEIKPWNEALSVFSNDLVLPPFSKARLACRYYLGSQFQLHIVDNPAKPKTAPGDLAASQTNLGPHQKRGSKLTVTLPKCENTAHHNNNNNKLETTLSNVSLKQVKRSKSQHDISRFALPPQIATKPRPSARLRYMQSKQQNISISDLRHCSYLRITPSWTHTRI